MDQAKKQGIAEAIEEEGSQSFRCGLVKDTIPCTPDLNGNRPHTDSVAMTIESLAGGIIPTQYWMVEDHSDQKRTKLSLLGKVP